MSKLLKKSLKASCFAAAAFALSATATQTMAAEPTKVTLNMVQIIGTIDPAKINDYTEYMSVVNLYDGLVTVDAQKGVVPNLAESWEGNADATEFTFKLRKDATFQDRSPVEASDVVYSMQRLLAVNEGPAYLFSEILDKDAIIAVDANTVKFKLKKPYSPFIPALSVFFILNEEVANANKGEDGWAKDYVAETPIGAGPYQLKSWERGSNMQLTRFENYYKGFSNSPIDQVRFVVAKDEGTIKSMLAKGELTITSQYQGTATYDAIEKLDNYKLVSKPGTNGFYVKLNNQVAPTDDVNIRKALACATDYDTIREVIFPGGAMNGPLIPAFGDVIAKDIDYPKFDLDCAKEYVAKSKYAGKGPIPIEMAYVAGIKFEEEIALLYKSVLDSIGFDTKITPEPWNRVTEIASKVETTPAMTQIFFGPTYPSPDSMFYTQYHSKAAGTWSSMSWLNNPKVDELIDQSRKEADAEKLKQIYSDLQHLLVDEQVDIFLLAQQVRVGMSECLDGFDPVPVQSFDFDFSRYSWKC